MQKSFRKNAPHKPSMMIHREKHLRNGGFTRNIVLSKEVFGDSLAKFVEDGDLTKILTPVFNTAIAKQGIKAGLQSYYFIAREGDVVVSLYTKDNRSTYRLSSVSPKLINPNGTPAFDITKRDRPAKLERFSGGRKLEDDIIKVIINSREISDCLQLDKWSPTDSFLKSGMMLSTYIEKRREEKSKKHYAGGNK